MRAEITGDHSSDSHRSARFMDDDDGGGLFDRVVAVAGSEPFHGCQIDDAISDRAGRREADQKVAASGRGGLQADGEWLWLPRKLREAVASVVAALFAASQGILGGKLAADLE